MSSKGRWVLSRFGLVGGSLVFTLIVAEVAVRMLGLAPPAGGGDSVHKALQFDEKLETRYIPGAHTTIRSQYGEFTIEYAFNQLGLRDRELPPRADDNSYRILVLGNSFVEGWGVDTEVSFLHAAEMRLQEQRQLKRSTPVRAPVPVRLINGGASGYGAAQCYLLMQELLPKTGADAVVFVYLPTMLPADYKFLAKASRDEAGLATGLDMNLLLKTPAPNVAAMGGDAPIGPGLAEYSGLARFVRARLANRAALKSIVPGDPQSDLLAPYRAPKQKLAELHAATFQHIAGMAKVARDAQVPFVVVQLPLPFEVSPVEWQHGRQLYGIPSEAASFPELTQLPAELLAKDAVPLATAHTLLAEKAAQRPGDPRIYYDFDFHLNTTGQQLLGDWLAEVLAKQLF
jgi:lysophospholipase L1-like esterase